MGQYHYVANYDKKEFIHPHKFGDGLKLLEFGNSAEGTMLGLAILLAASNKGGGRGGGDLNPDTDTERSQWLLDNVVGRWAGDRIAIIGDYAEPEDANGLVGREGSPWPDDSEAAGWKEISADVIEAMELDTWIRDSRKESRSQVA